LHQSEKDWSTISPALEWIELETPVSIGFLGLICQAIFLLSI